MAERETEAEGVSRFGGSMREFIGGILTGSGSVF
jgi:hypothetical protein